MTALNELTEALLRRRLTLFIGADLPSSVTGLPSRSDLAHGLARKKGLPDSPALAATAQKAARGGNRWDFTDYLTQNLDLAGARPQPFHELVARLAPPTILTTAYDTLLEQAFQRVGQPYNRLVRGSDAAFLDPGRTTIVKLYGDIQQRDSLVVTEDDLYGLWRNRDKEELMTEARQALSRTLVLFLGCDLASPDFLLLWREVLDRVGRFGAGAYAAMPSLPPDEAQVWNDRQIRIIDDQPLAVLSQLAVLTHPNESASSAPAAPDAPPSLPVTAPSSPAPALTPEQAAIVELKRRRLHELEKRAALYGIDTPAHISIEIEDLRKEIRQLEAGG